MNKKSDKKDKEITLTELIDEFFARKYAGEEPTIEEYIERYPEYADDIRKEFEDELFWLSKCKELKKPLKIVSTEEEIQKGWERVLAKISVKPLSKPEKLQPWEKATNDLRRLIGDIRICASKLVISDNLKPFISHKVTAAPAMLGAVPEIEEIEIPILEIKGSLKIIIFPSETAEPIEIKVQPKIEGAPPKELIPIILKDREKNMLLQVKNIPNGQTHVFQISIGKKYSISIKWMGKTYEVPFDLEVDHGS